MVSKNIEETSKVTEAEKIWNRIKDLPFEIFALPNQTISNYAERVQKMEKVSPDTLHLLLRSSAVRPLLEEFLTKIRLPKTQKFVVGDVHKYTTITIVDVD
jgi:hypothetical protein